MSSSSAPAVPYAVGDVILVEQGNQLHAARVLELGPGPEEGEDVFIHYLGWSDKWDNWAKLEHTRPNTPESRAEQARMKEALKQSKNKSNKKRKMREGDGTEPASKAPDVSEAVAAALTSATAALSVDKDGVSSVASDLVPPMPSSLRRRLVLDWERLTRRQQILRLPTRLSVVMLLTAFVRDHKASSGHEKTAEMDEAKHELVLQVCEGLLCYFERCLSSILLYRIERPQMQQLVHQHNLKAPEPGQSDPPLFNIQHMTRTLPNPPPTAHPAVSSTSSSSSSSSAPSSAPTSVLVHWLGDASTAAASPTAVVPQWSGVYGVEHLVRMLCKLPAILRGGEVEWETEQRQAVRYTLLALYRWLSAHDELIYSYSSYEPATVEYMSKLQQPQHNGVQNSDSAKPSTDQEKQQQQHSNGQKKLDLPRAHSPSKAKRKR